MAGRFWWTWPRHSRREWELLDADDPSRRVRFRFVNVQRAVCLVVRHRIVRRGTQRIDRPDMRR